MRLSCTSLLVATTLAALPATSHATVDGMIDYTVIYQQLQTNDRCVMRMPMLATLGVPPASAMKAIFSPTRVFNDMVATSTPMVATYVRDGYTGTTISYSMTVDVTALARANGTTTAGRQRTLTSAKLGLLAMAYTLDDMSQGDFRLTVRFVGLPSQTGLSGTRLYATTTYPYSSSSPLIQAYGHELINVEGTCPVH